MPEKYLKAVLRGEAFALAAQGVVCVLSGAAVAVVPCAPQGVSGLLFYNGTVVPVMDSLGEDAATGPLQIIYQKGGRLVAYTADWADGFVSLTDETIAQCAPQSPLPGVMRLAAEENG